MVLCKNSFDGKNAESVLNFVDEHGFYGHKKNDGALYVGSDKQEVRVFKDDMLYLSESGDLVVEKPVYAGNIKTIISNEITIADLIFAVEQSCDTDQLCERLNVLHEAINEHNGKHEDQIEKSIFELVNFDVLSTPNDTDFQQYEDCIWFDEEYCIMFDPDCNRKIGEYKIEKRISF